MSILGIIICIIPLLIWLIFNIYYLFKNVKKIVIENNKNTKITVKCEKCNKEHNIDINEFLSSHLKKEKTLEISPKIALTEVKKIHYYYFAKRFFCPFCKKKTWSEIKDYNNFTKNNTKETLPIIIKHLLIMLIGGYILIKIIGFFTRL